MNTTIAAILLGLPLLSPAPLRHNAAPGSHGAALHSPTSFQYYISVKGTKQGQLKGESNSKNGREKDGWFQVVSFDMGGEVPVDVRSGESAAAGKRTHKPFSITREVDEASPAIFRAFQSNEVLSSVILQAVQESNGKEIEAYHITLTNAIISKLENNRATETVVPKGGNETIVLNYETITRQQISGSSGN